MEEYAPTKIEKRARGFFKGGEIKSKTEHAFGFWFLVYLPISPIFSVYGYNT